MKNDEEKNNNKNILEDMQLHMMLLRFVTPLKLTILPFCNVKGVYSVIPIKRTGNQH